MKKVVVLVSCSLLLASFVVLEQLLDPYWAGWELVIQRHEDMLQKQAHFFNPWQYRILSTYLLEAVLQLWEKLPLPEISTPGVLQEKGIDLGVHLPFIGVKWLILVGIFFASAHYFSSQGIKALRLQILGIWLAALCMYPAQFSAGLSLDIYLEVLFYMLAALCILKERWEYLPILCFLAVLNRESSGFIPFMLLSYYLFCHSEKGQSIRWASLKKRLVPSNRAMGVFLLSSTAYLIGFIGLRIYFGYPPARSVYGNQTLGDFMIWNLGQALTYYQLLRSFTLLPFFALWFYPHWPKTLKVWGGLILPAWLILHLGHAVVRETRLFLVPVCLILIPSILWAIQSLQNRKDLPSIKG